ncbi:MAG: tetratricopeptide repeat protein [Planctomycetota bacterium]|nr:tetratricopeptide repeat protein [Planctomycetota bacterium]
MTHASIQSILAATILVVTTATATRADDAAGVVSPHVVREADPPLEMFTPEGLERRHRWLSTPVSEEEPEVDSGDRESMVAATDLINLGDSLGAIGVLEAARGASTGAMAEYFLGTLHYGLKDWDRAEAAFLLATEKAPGFRRAWMQLGDTRMRKGDFAGALPALSRARSLGAIDPVTAGMIGFASAKTGGLRAAEAAYRDATLTDPESQEYRLGLTQALDAQGRYGAVATALGRFAREQPDDPQWWFYQAVAFNRLGRNDLMIQNFELLEELGGASTESTLNLARAYVNQGLSDAAVERFLRYLRMQEDPPTDPVFDAASAMIRRQDLEPVDRLLSGLRACCEDALDGLERRELLKLEARLASLRGDRDTEAAILADVVALAPDDGETMLLLAQYHARRDGGMEEAVSWYRKAAAVPAVATQARVEHAGMLARNGRIADAIEILRASEQADPRPEVADFLERLEDYERARTE